MSREKIALLTYKDGAELADGEKLLPPAFENANVEAVATPWDGDVNWNDYPTIILRACWNYHLDKDRFISWLDERSKKGAKIWNPPEIVKWNTDKHYLLELEAKGVPIIPTHFLEPGDSTNLTDILVRNNWENAVVKPVVGASAFEVRKFNLGNAVEVESKLDRAVSWIIQKFCPEINISGEYSFMFFNRKYSHAVMKKPDEADFRTQPHYGGSEWTVRPDSGLVDQASNVLDKITGPLLYARVDGILINDIFHLMELELVEPYLFFERDEKSAERFVEAYKTLWAISQK